ncbi:MULTISPECIES: peroxiredoxin-like family protein [Roseibium]|uniref:peroxiredoxin-like family protein n=1 Tax=Roseibium TaxID=150830 RepID=UPI001A8F2A1A|nr:peroxiredoxin-like family protein [Roseibium aggregatum]MBN8184765.1 AhpC/TSA family protein [Roseibium aggregatum]MCR9282595.1 AhpC/TSA family protein [Paracoccaceae bacterium]MEE4011281.1 peroxiredoxin-like family protein [Roseibium sp. FZY0029]
MAKNKRLKELLLENEERLKTGHPAVSQEYQNIVSRLVAAEAGETCPKIDDQLPEFQLPDHRGRLISLGDLLTNGPLVLSMNRGHWCSVCRLELTQIEKYSERIADLGAGIVAITPESRSYANRLRDRCGLSFPVLTDVDNGYALSLGLAVWLGDELKTLFTKNGSDLVHVLATTGWVVPIPATFVVASDGRILDRYVNADFRKRKDPEDILAVLKSL